jgi:hypothetical protein
MTNSPRQTSLDDLRARFPQLGFAIYAIDPADPITLEVHLPDGTVQALTGNTWAETAALAFPETPDPFG